MILSQIRKIGRITARSTNFMRMIPHKNGIHYNEAYCSPGKLNHIQKTRASTVDLCRGIGNDLIKFILDYAKPQKRLISAISVRGDVMAIQSLSRTYELKHNVFVIATGKAGLLMAEATSHLLDEHIIKGLIVCPKGSLKAVEGSYEVPRKFTIIEASKNNIPDDDSVRAAKEIVSILLEIPSDSIIIVLLSGGTSACIAFPIPGIDLSEYISLVKSMMESGMSIHNMNTVRKRVDLVKGGGLGILGHKCQMITLMLSDVVGNVAQSIGSAPTMTDVGNGIEALHLLRNKHIPISDNLENILTKDLSKEQQLTNLLKLKKPLKNDLNHVRNVIIGSNDGTAEAVIKHMKENKMFGVHVTSLLQGDVQSAAECIDVLIQYVMCVMNGWKGPLSGTYSNVQEVEFACIRRGLKKSSLVAVVKEAERAALCHEKLLLVLGGEVTVAVTGTGKGGRNQELALRLCNLLRLSCFQQKSFDTSHKSFSYDVLTFCLATDGQDGPTDASGAYASAHIYNAALEQGLDPQKFLDNNDSWTFFDSVSEGSYHIKTGLSGTNVMDIVGLIFSPVR